MDLKKAFIILEIENIEYNDINIGLLKQKYHRLALLYHPDKNKSKDAAYKFREIKDAYDYLINEFNLLNDETIDDKYDYKKLLQVFLKSVFNNYSEIINELLKNLTSGYLDISISIVDKLDKETAINIYSFLEKYKGILHIENELIDAIKNSLIKKCGNITIYKLNPTIIDLFENNVYKLNINNKIYHVPLWHNEMYYDTSGNQIIVICEPQIPNNIYIDEDNNIYISKNIDISELPKLYKNKYYKFIIGKKYFEIPIHELYIRDKQTYIFKNQGISIIKQDIYDIDDKSDVIVKLQFI